MRERPICWADNEKKLRASLVLDFFFRYLASEFARVRCFVDGRGMCGGLCSRVVVGFPCPKGTRIMAEIYVFSQNGRRWKEDILFGKNSI